MFYDCDEQKQGHGFSLACETNDTIESDDTNNFSEAVCQQS